MHKQIEKIIYTLLLFSGMIVPTLFTPEIAFSKTSRKYTDLRRMTLGKIKSKETIEIRVPVEAKSVLFTARTKNTNEELSIIKITDPSGQVIYDYDPIEDKFVGKLFGDALYDDGEVTLFMPTQPKFQLKSGIYKVQVHSENNSPLRGEVFIKTGDINSLQKINLHIWLVTKYRPLYKKSIQKRMITQLRKGINKILTPHQLSVGIIQVSKVNQKMIQKYSKILPTENDGINSDLCRQIARRSKHYRQLNILLIDEFLVTKEQKKKGETPYIGLSPGMPAMIPTKNSLHSCVLSALDGEYNFRNNDQDLTIWHEGLHYMSIPHTTESEGSEFDYFTDTPECDRETYDEDGDGTVDTDECEDVDVENVMFWEEGEGNMSREQAWVIRRHPLFYPARKK